MLAILCPGQGAQTPAMLAPWLEEPRAREALAAYSEVAKVDLELLGTTADADTIRDTANAQPLIVAASLLSLYAIFGTDRSAIALSAGHSVGELAAAVVTGVLTDLEAMALVAARGRAMAEAAALTPTGMSAIVGGAPEDVATAIAQHGLTAANVNGGGQIVAAGTREQLEALAASPPAKARVMPLPVAGAFHTSHMAPAVAAVEEAVTHLLPADPVRLLLSNGDGQAVASGTDAIVGLVAQVARPVRWDACSEEMLARGVTGAIELAPGGVLTGLARRTLRGVETIAIKTPDDVDAARELAERHGGAR